MYDIVIIPNIILISPFACSKRAKTGKLMKTLQIQRSITVLCINILPISESHHAPVASLNVWLNLFETLTLDIN